MMSIDRAVLRSGRISVLAIIMAAVLAGCIGHPRQERFLRIDGLVFLSRDLDPPESWQGNEDALWAKGQVQAIAGATPTFLVGVEREEPCNRDAYLAVWVVRCSKGGSLLVTRDYVIESLLFWTETQERLLAAVPLLENTVVPVTAEELERLEVSLARLSPHKCTDTVRFWPLEQSTFHVQGRLRGKEIQFSVFGPALSDLDRTSPEGSAYAEYDRLSRREADVVAVVLDFADERLLKHFKVGPMPQWSGPEADPEHFGGFKDDETDQGTGK